MSKLTYINMCLKCEYCKKGNCLHPGHEGILPLKDIYSIPSWCPLEDISLPKRCGWIICDRKPLKSYTTDCGHKIFFKSIKGIKVCPYCKKEIQVKEWK